MAVFVHLKDRTKFPARKYPMPDGRVHVLFADSIRELKVFAKCIDIPDDKYTNAYTIPCYVITKRQAKRALAEGAEVVDNSVYTKAILRFQELKRIHAVVSEKPVHDYAAMLNATKAWEEDRVLIWQE